MDLEDVLNRVRRRLAGPGYGNEASVSQGVVLPILAALGWDTTDTDEVAPEFANERGRVDYALCNSGRRPTIFIEVKGVGRSLDGDRQLFEYAFHTGVPLCLLTDGREWAFYLPGGQGTYEDRRVYRLQLDERAPAEAVERLRRYLGRERVRSGDAQEDARRDHRDIAAKREAALALPRAWAELVSKGEDLLLELLAEEAEQLCGVRPPSGEVQRFLRSLSPGNLPSPEMTPSRAVKRSDELRSGAARADEAAAPPTATSPSPRKPLGKLIYSWSGEEFSAPTAAAATVEILRRVCARHPDRMPELAERVQGRRRNNIARSPQEINPDRPELAKAVEIIDGWLVGLHTANREKMKVIRAACDVMGVNFGTELQIELPNG